jgi:hypothetical protein
VTRIDVKQRDDRGRDLLCERRAYVARVRTAPPLRGEGNPRGAECQPVGAVAMRVNPRGRSSATGRPVLSDPFRMSTPSWDLPALPQSKGGRRIGASDRNLGRGESPAVAEAGHDDSAALLAAHPIWPGRAAEGAASRS